MQKIKIFFEKYRNRVVLAVLVIYMLLLGLGAAGELWKIDSILGLLIFNV